MNDLIVSKQFSVPMIRETLKLQEFLAICFKMLLIGNSQTES